LAEEAPRVDKWEIPREKLHILRAIGEGAFGVVMEGAWDTGNHLLCSSLFHCNRKLIDDQKTILLMRYVLGTARENVGM